MRAFITQHGSVLVAMVALRQQPEAQQNDEQTDSLENLVPHINVLAEFTYALGTGFKLIMLHMRTCCISLIW